MPGNSITLALLHEQDPENNFREITQVESVVDLTTVETCNPTTTLSAQNPRACNMIHSRSGLQWCGQQVLHCCLVDLQRACNNLFGKWKLLRQGSHLLASSNPVSSRKSSSCCPEPVNLQRLESNFEPSFLVAQNKRQQDHTACNRQGSSSSNGKPTRYKWPVIRGVMKVRPPPGGAHGCKQQYIDNVTERVCDIFALKPTTSLRIGFRIDHLS